MKRPHTGFLWSIVFLTLTCGQSLKAQQPGAETAGSIGVAGRLPSEPQIPLTRFYQLGKPIADLPEIRVRSYNESAIPATPQPLVLIRTPYRRSPLLITLYVAQGVLQGLDAESTLRGIRSNNGQELNPILSPFASHAAAFITLKASLAVVGIYGVDLLHRYHPRFATSTLAFINAAYAIVVLHNFQQVPFR